MRAQRRMQKSRLSRKGFSAAGTGVTSGSSLACVSQKARSSAAACDTCRRGVEMQSTRPNDLVPGKTPKSPPRILTTPCLTTPPGRDPPSHSSSFPRLLPQQSLAQTPPPPQTISPTDLRTFMRSMFTSSFSCSTVLRASAILAMLLDMAAAEKGLNAWQEWGLGPGTRLDPPGSSEKQWCDPVTGEVVGITSKWGPRDR